MSENKFIKHLRGKGTAKSVLEVKNQNTPTSFANMPDGSSNANDTYSDYRGNATSVLKGTENWKLDTATLVESATVYGDGRDMTGSYDANGSTLWVDATATFSASRRYSPNTKFVLKLCGNNLLSATEETIDFTLLVNIGTTTVTKTFTIAEQANFFCKEFVIDFSESNGNTIKIAQNDTINVQLLCGDPNASATIYNGMTVFTALQRRVDADAVSSDTRTLDELEEDFEEFMSDTETALNGKVSKTGDTMSGALDIANIASSNTPLLTLTHSSTATYKWNIAPRYNSTTLSVYPGSTETNGFRFATTGFVPASNNARYLGSASLKWKGIYVGVINNGADLTVPNKTGTLATMGDVELAARSGRMLTDQGVWYAKMYAATVVPTGAEYDGKNYADFSQVDADNNPIIKIYTGASGVWTLSETITPPAEYDGYVPITSKIWDIAEQTGQQGGRVLWNHQSKEFTPYPNIISFDGQNITNSTFSYGTITYSTFSGTATLSGTSTVVMPEDPTGDQIVNKDYVDNHIPTGNFYHPDLFDWKWADHQLNDVQWLRADTFSWQSGSVYPAAYKHLRNDMYNWYSWANNGSTIYTKKAYPEVGEKAYSDSALTTEVGEITDVTDTLDITVEKITVNGVVYDSVSGSNIAPTTETVGGVTVQYIPAEDGHKIVTDFHESEVADAYAATGVAWYYIIDYGFKRFKLPRTRWGVTGYRDGVGNYVNQNVVLPKMEGVFSGGKTKNTYTGPFFLHSTESSAYPSGTNTAGNVVGFDTSRLNSVYSGDGTDTLIQPRGTQMYLYFYVGEFTQTAIENTAGLNAELFNGKVDVGHEVIAFQVPTAGNNYTWYRKYADGWVEQGGFANVNEVSTTTITLPVTMADTNYIALAQNNTLSTAADTENGVGIEKTSTTQVTLFTHYINPNTISASWEVKGMAA